MNCTSIQITQYELLAQILEHNNQNEHELTAAGASLSEIADALNELVPVFKSKRNFCSSLERLALVYRDEPEADLCRLYLTAVQGKKYENI